MNSDILDLAKKTILSFLQNTTLPSKEYLVKKDSRFGQKTATFVTLNLNGNLRGCIGSLVATRDLYDDIIHNAQSAAFNDPRFAPLSIEEFKNIDLEISILTPAHKLEYSSIDDLKSKIKIGEDGVILKYNSYQATFLPQVWDQLQEFEIFFAHLCNKAGLNSDCLNNHPQIYTYKVQKIK
jgi:AmmeMemoRadiSam system protein A